MPQNKIVSDGAQRTYTSTAATPHRSPQQSSRSAFQAAEVSGKTPQTVSRAPAPRATSTDSDEPEPEPDYPALLCAIADDYVDEARKEPALTERYCVLISKALGCLESALANFKLPPLKEARISLRYCRILYDETENHDEAETALTKSIELCERHKFVDLKYEMQLLLSKVLYESKPKAALKAIQRMIEDIEAYHHTVWLYIFSFQHAMFSLASSAPGEFHSAVVQLEKISVLAKQNSDAGVLAFAATLEALLHLSSSSHEAVTATQTALAKARAMQLNPDIESNPQMSLLWDFIDLACSVRESNIAQTNAKRRAIIEVLDNLPSVGPWTNDKSIYIPVSKRTIAGIQLQAQKHVIERNKKYYIVFSWLGMEEADALACLLCADSSAYKNGKDGGKAELFATEGLSKVRSLARPTLTTGSRQSERLEAFQKLLEGGFLLLLSFLQCSKGQWHAADQYLSEATKVAEIFADAFPLNLRYATLYLRGVIRQGTGDLVGALHVYQSSLFNLAPQQSSSSAASSASNQLPMSDYPNSDVTRNFSILAAMNSAFIIQAPNHPQHKRLSSLIKELQVAVPTCGNKYIQAHFSLLISVLSGTTLTVKQYLKSAMEAGKAIGSAQTTALALIYMQEKMFKGVVDEQALKCAKAATLQTSTWGDPMWMHVTAGLEAQALDINGFENQARQRRREAEAGWDMLPDAVKSASAAGSKDGH
jgi:tetratricopeptide (TPR) repeat protein